MSDEQIEEVTEEEVAEDAPKRGRPKKRPEIQCVWTNVWTSEGQMFKGETMELDAEEADALKEIGAVQ